MAGFSSDWISVLAQGTPSSLLQLLPIGVIMAIFYVLLILPAQRRQKKTQEMIGALKKGDKVITSGGIFGTIVAFDNEAVLLQVSDSARLKVLKSAIAGLQSDPPAES
ncbi:MAG: preprotein translocase subunit YajC [Acidobacteria bacterium]|nr:preprotein translocase subunit YajC [Acidobacteriota bacterium]